MGVLFASQHNTILSFYLRNGERRKSCFKMACCNSCSQSRPDPGSSVKGLCAPVKQMYSTAAQERSQMQELNNVLAGYIDKVRQMRAQVGANLDPKAYKEAMRALEDEMMNLKNMYERELGRLRETLDDANRERSSLVANLNAYNTKSSNLQNRLDAETSGNQRVLQENATLTRTLAEKEKELAQLRGCFGNCQSELELVKPQLQRSLQDLDSLRRRLETEQGARIAAEDKLKSLCDKASFDNNASNQANRDLQDRVKVLNEVISSLEVKIQELSHAQGDSTASLLQKLRDGTNSELRRYKQEADEVLTKAIRVMKNQREEDTRSKEGLFKDKSRLEVIINQLQGRIADLEGQLASCNSQKSALESALHSEQERTVQHVRGLEKKLADMNDQVIAKAKDITDAREAQVTLQTEINTYKTLLDQDQGFPGVSRSVSRSAAAVPPTPRGNAPTPRVRTSMNAWKPAHNMPHKECSETTFDLKPRVNLTEYNDRYNHPFRFQSGLPHVNNLGQSVAVYNSRPTGNNHNMYQYGVPSDLRLLNRSNTCMR